MFVRAKCLGTHHRLTCRGGRFCSEYFSSRNPRQLYDGFLLLSGDPYNANKRVFGANQAGNINDNSEHTVPKKTTRRLPELALVPHGGMSAYAGNLWRYAYASLGSLGLGRRMALKIRLLNIGKASISPA